MPEVPSSPFRVLVVEEDRTARTTLSLCLEAMGCDVVQAPSGAAALGLLSTRTLDLAFVDIRNGLDLLPDILSERPTLEIVVLSSHAAVDAAAEAIRRGAHDYLPKPFTPAQIRIAVERARERLRLAQKIIDLEGRIAEGSSGNLVSTESPHMRAVLDLVARAARLDAAVLLRGENGTGRTELARALHVLSVRRERPMVVVNCPSLSEDFLTSELFGHAMGAFRGAVWDQVGRMETANGGVLFLSEIGEMPLQLQGKILRFMEEGKFERVGETKSRTADVRIVAGTSQDLRAASRQGRFRKELLARLDPMKIDVPPLRERKEDILPLARVFTSHFAHATKRATPAISGDAERVLQTHSWPGNIRELRNAVERAVILTSGDVIGGDAFPSGIAGHPDGQLMVGGDFSIQEIEKAHILRVIDRMPTIERAAKLLGIDVSTIWRKRRKYQATRRQGTA